MSTETTVLETPLFVEYDPTRHRDTVTGAPRTNADGTPKRGPGRPPGSPNKAPSVARKAPAAKPAAKPAAGPDYRAGVMGIARMLAAPLAMAGQPADAVAIVTHAPPIADALQNLATARPEVAAALDRVMAVGPYAELLGAVIPLVVQLAHNHGFVPADMAVQMGATPKSEIMAALRTEGEALAGDDASRR